MPCAVTPWRWPEMEDRPSEVLCCNRDWRWRVSHSSSRCPSRLPSPSSRKRLPTVPLIHQIIDMHAAMKACGLQPKPFIEVLRGESWNRAKEDDPRETPTTAPANANMQIA